VQSLGEISVIETNEFIDNTFQNKKGQVRQGYYLDITVHDQNNEPLYNVEITVIDSDDNIISNSNSGTNDTITLDLAEKIIDLDGTSRSYSQYNLVLEKTGYERSETKLSLNDDQELVLKLTEEKLKEKSTPGFGVEFLLSCLIILAILGYSRRKSNTV
jgi:hypothetical protein